MYKTCSLVQELPGTLQSFGSRKTAVPGSVLNCHQNLPSGVKTHKPLRKTNSKVPNFKILEISSLTLDVYGDKV